MVTPLYQLATTPVKAGFSLFMVINLKFLQTCARMFYLTNFGVCILSVEGMEILNGTGKDLEWGIFLVQKN